MVPGAQLAPALQLGISAHFYWFFSPIVFLNEPLKQSGIGSLENSKTSRILT
jgi:hypothetical protein